MALVTIQILSDEPSPEPIADVLVQVYGTNAIFQTSSTTNEEGRITVSLPPETYDLIFFKSGVSFEQPLRFEITDNTNHSFELEAHIHSRPESIDSKKCKISGYIVGVDGGRYKTSIVFRPWKELIIAQSNVVALQASIEVFSNDNGYFEFELLRNKQFVASFVTPRSLFGEDPGLIKVITPNGPSVDLYAFLFPMPVHMEFSSNTISLVAEDEQDESISYLLTYNDSSERTSLSSPWGGVFLTNTDNRIVEACFIEGKLILKPLTPGVATITTTRVVPSTVDYDPLPIFTSESVTVTVLP